MRIDDRLLGTLVALALATDVGAQGMGDAAKREAERRKAAQQKAAPVKSYSDQDLPSSQAASPVAEEATADATEATGEAEGSPEGGATVVGGLPMGTSGRKVKDGSSRLSPRERDAATAAAVAEAEAEASGQNPRSEASWHTAARNARRGIRAAEQRVHDLDFKAAGLMYAPVSPGCKLSGSAAAQMTKEQLLKYKCQDDYTRWQGERQRALEALARAKVDLDQAQKDLEALEQSARRQGAPPGWLRE